MKLKFVKTILAIGAAVISLATSAAFADSVSFNYQGKVKVQGKPFDGTAQLKFAILSTNEKSVLWSNDGTVGVGANPNLIPVPVNYITLPVTDGVFSVQIGDTAIPGMAPLDSAILVSDTTLRLRVWFNDGTHGFEELKPDFKLLDLTLNKIQTGLSDYTIYVNGTTGDDLNNGLTTGTAKKTISGAVDIIPDKVRCNITVDIADGVYEETVNPNAINVNYGKKLIFKGDEDWTPSAASVPAVVIDGSTGGTTGTATRDFGIIARQCSGIEFIGLGFRYQKTAGLKLENGVYVVTRCMAYDMTGTNRHPLYGGVGIGFHAGPQAFTNFNECKATRANHSGFAVETGSRALLTTCTATNNITGLFTASHSTSQLFGYNNFSNNTNGLQANSMSDVSIWPAGTTSASQRSNISGNSSGVLVNWGGQFDPSDAIFSGNGQKYTIYYGTVIGQ